MKTKLSFLSLLGSLLVGATAWAGPREVILALDHRPTVKEIREAFGGHLPEQNPFGTPDPKIRAAVLANAPSVIATFEKSFPGATYAALGRDSVFLGDIIDAFYQSLGQERVARVSASGASLSNDPKDIVDFLRGAGFDLGQVDSKPAYIMFDQTNFADNSQSTRYLKAIYAACHANPKCDSAKLVRHFNFLNTGATAKDMYNKNVIDPKFAIAAFLDERAEFARKEPKLDKILSVDVATSLVYTAVYHDTFTKFERHGSEVTTKPGKMSENNIRLQILADVFEVMKLTSTPAFRASVDWQAQKLGYNFPPRRLTNEKAIEDIRTRIPAERTKDELLAKLSELMREHIKIPTRNFEELWYLLLGDASLGAKDHPRETWSAYLKAWLHYSEANKQDNGRALGRAVGEFIQRTESAGIADVYTFQGELLNDLLRSSELARRVLEEDLVRVTLSSNPGEFPARAYVKLYRQRHSGENDLATRLAPLAFAAVDADLKAALARGASASDINTLISGGLNQVMVGFTNFDRSFAQARLAMAAYHAGKVNRAGVELYLFSAVAKLPDGDDAALSSLTEFIRKSRAARELFESAVNAHKGDGDTSIEAVTRVRTALAQKNVVLPAPVASRSIPNPMTVDHLAELAASADRRELNEEAAGNSLMSVINGIAKEDATSRTKVVQILRGSPALQRTFQGYMLKRLSTESFHQHYYVNFEKIYLEWKSRPAAEFRRQYLRSYLAKQFAVTAQITQAITNLPHLMKWLNGATEKDLATNWLVTTELLEEFGSKNQLAEEYRADALWWMLYKQDPKVVELLVEPLRKMLQTNSTFARMWNDSYLPKLSKVPSESATDILTTSLRVQGISAVEWANKLVPMIVRNSVAQNIGGKQLVAAVLQSTERFQGLSAADAFHTRLDVIANLYERKIFGNDDLELALGGISPATDETLAAKKAFQEVLSRSPRLKEALETWIPVRALKVDVRDFKPSPLWTFVQAMSLTPGEKFEQSARKSLKAVLESIKRSSAHGQRNYEKLVVSFVETTRNQLGAQASGADQLALARVTMDELFSLRNEKEITSEDVAGIFDHVLATIPIESEAGQLEAWRHENVQFEQFLRTTYTQHILQENGDEKGRSLAKSVNFQRLARTTSFARVIDGELIRNLTEQLRSPVLVGDELVSTRPRNLAERSASILQSLRFAGSKTPAPEFRKYLDALTESLKANQLNFGDRFTITRELVAFTELSPAWFEELAAQLRSNETLRNLFRNVSFEAAYGRNRAAYHKLLGEAGGGWREGEVTRGILSELMAELKRRNGGYAKSVRDDSQVFARWFSLALSGGTSDGDAVLVFLEEMTGANSAVHQWRSLEVPINLLPYLQLADPQWRARFEALAANRPQLRAIFEAWNENALILQPRARQEYSRLALRYRWQDKAGGRPLTVGEWAGLLLRKGGSPLAEIISADNSVLLQEKISEALADATPASRPGVLLETVHAFKSAVHLQALTLDDAGRLFRDFVARLGPNDAVFTAELQKMYEKDPELRALWGAARKQTGESMQAVEISRTKRCMLAVKRAFGN